MDLKRKRLQSLHNAPLLNDYDIMEMVDTDMYAAKIPPGRNVLNGILLKKNFLI